MAGSSVLIVGLNGLGVEAAKNIILSGVKSVTLLDNTVASFEDLSSQFFLTESDIGQSRAIISAPKLAELNPYVHVSVITEELTHSLLSQFNVVVLVGQEFSLQLWAGEYCHSNNIAFIASETGGVFGSLFCDFGEAFVVFDTNGEQAATAMVASITRDSPCLVTVLEETRHNLETGDIVVLSELVGMEELNGREFRVTVKDLYSFEINEDSSSFSPYQRCGYMNQIKPTQTISFKSMAESLKAPGAIITDEMKSHLGGPLHITWRTLHEYQRIHHRTPTPGDLADADSFFHLAVAMNAQALVDGNSFSMDPSQLQEKSDLLHRFALCCRGQISPVCALMGGILGQEILKACSGKFMPIRQWYYYEALDALPEVVLDQSEVTPQGCRYDGQIMVFGRTLQEKLGEWNMFLVGAGAIGCEMLKNWAMMGVASGPGGSEISDPSRRVGMVHVTDMDQIERSNLSRQFLFRNSDIGQLKSVTAVCAVRAMNPAFRSTAYESKVAPETEAFFNDDFFEALDGVCAALDNVEARLYLDQRCLFYHVPMMESGTLGAKGHTQVVVPRKTEHYGASRDPPEKSIPICTLKSFPNQIEHTLQWSREWFEEAFKQTPEDANNYLTNADFVSTLAAQQNTKLDTLQRIHESLVDQRPATYADCIAWARVRFEDMFNNRILQLLHNLPLDKLTTSGALFWSGSKKPPAALHFNAADALHVEFLLSVAAMRAAMFHLAVPATPLSANEIAVTCNHVVLPVFRAAERAVATTDEEEKTRMEEERGLFDIDAQCNQVLGSLPSPSSLPGFQLQVAEFDKDQDAHMRVVAAAANLRARNYRIPEADLHAARGIAGKIMPAIATTTALVTGLSCMELYKIVQGKAADKFLNTFTNLAVPLFTSMEPQPPSFTHTVVKGDKWSWSQWDRIDVREPSMTLAQLIVMLEERYGAELGMLSSGVTILYSNFMNAKKLQERKNMTLKEIVESVTKKAIPSAQKYLIFELILNDSETDEELEIPYLRFRI